MKILLFGATGMVGKGVLLECLRDSAVAEVIAVVRRPLDVSDPKLRAIVRPEVTDLAGLEPELRSIDACLFCLGVSSGGMREEQYTRLTYDLTMTVARTLAEIKPGMRFLYISGAGTDSSERGRTMWARVKGRTENALLALPLDGYMFRPGLIQPLDGIRSRTPLYRAIYGVSAPLLPLLRRLFPNAIVTTRELGQAMLRVARSGYSRPILETHDIRAALNQKLAR